MEAVGVTRRRAGPSTLAGLQYPHRLQVYDAAPTLELSLEEFETHALDRLQRTWAPASASTIPC
jgi:hypothetical protein